MEVHTFFLYLLIILLTARIFAELAVRLQTPSVIGELVAGVVLGPSLLGWVEPVEAIKLLAEIGIILLLFEVGLETDVMRLVRTGMKSFIVAMAGFILPFVLGFSLSYWMFGLSLLVALFIGGTLTATSIGITVRVLTDLRRHQALEGQVVLGARGAGRHTGRGAAGATLRIFQWRRRKPHQCQQGIGIRRGIFRAGARRGEADFTDYQTL